MRKSAFSIQLRPVAALIAGFVLAFAVAWIDLTTYPVLNPAILMIVALVVVACARRCLALWCMTAFTLATAGVVVFFELAELPAGQLRTTVLINRVFTVVTLLIVSFILDAWIRADHARARKELELSEKNQELATQQESVRHQAAALEEQTRTLQRQSEALRSANEELARGQRMLQVLLDLSRALRLQVDEPHAMEQICRTLAGLVDGAAGAAILLIHESGDAIVHCQFGFEESELRPERVPKEKSLAAQVVRNGRTEAVDELSNRPGFQIPQPANGEPMRSVIATPLVVQGQRIGAVEIYSRQPHQWTEQEIALTESLAAQTAVTLENVRLFREIDQGRRRLQAILESVPVGLLVASANLDDVRFNAAGAAMLGMPADENVAPGYPAWSVIENGNAIPQAQYALARAVGGERVAPREVEVQLPEGKRLMVLSSAAPFHDAQGKILGAIQCIVDISEFKSLQRELETRRREAEEANVRKTRFLAAASHDIRTPANAISLLAELLKRTADNPEMSNDIPELAEELRQSASSLVNLVSNVLDVTRFDTDKLELHETEFVLRRLLDEESRQVLPLAQAKQLSVDIQPQVPPIWLRADRIKLGRVIGNLLGNAIKFTDRGSIRVLVSRDDVGCIRIAVSDSGIGITPENQSRIFEEFWHLSDPHRAKGSGLGLSISKRLIEAMGGRLSVASEPGQGSTFTIVLPASAVLARPDADAQMSEAAR
jgi:PAS domain S-box-containing protein